VSQYRWRVSFTDDTPARDVIAQTAEGAKRTAVYGERVTGNPARKLRVLRVERLFEVGWRAQLELFGEGNTHVA
jgi:hypothetical protein